VVRTWRGWIGRRWCRVDRRDLTTNFWTGI